jgi:hypothetical protein
MRGLSSPLTTQRVGEPRGRDGWRPLQFTAVLARFAGRANNTIGVFHEVRDGSRRRPRPLCTRGQGFREARGGVKPWAEGGLGAPA